MFLIQRRHRLAAGRLCYQGKLSIALLAQLDQIPDSVQVHGGDSDTSGQTWLPKIWTSSASPASMISRSHQFTLLGVPAIKPKSRPSLSRRTTQNLLVSRPPESELLGL